MLFSRIISSFLIFSYCFSFAMESPTFDWPSSAKPKQQNVNANANAWALPSLGEVGQADDADVKRGMEDCDEKVEAEHDNPRLNLTKAIAAENALFGFEAFQRDLSVPSAEIYITKNFSFDAVQEFLAKNIIIDIDAIRVCRQNPGRVCGITPLDRKFSEVFQNPYLIISAYLIGDFIFSKDEKKKMNALIHELAFSLEHESLDILLHLVGVEGANYVDRNFERPPLCSLVDMPIAHYANIVRDCTLEKALKRQKATAMVLFKHGAQLNRPEAQLLIRAFHAQNYELARSLIKLRVPLIVLSDNGKKFPVIAWFATLDSQAVRILIEEGVDIHQMPETGVHSGRTPTFISCFAGDEDVFFENYALLLFAGGRIDKLGDTDIEDFEVTVKGTRTIREGEKERVEEITQTRNIPLNPTISLMSISNPDRNPHLYQMMRNRFMNMQRSFAARNQSASMFDLVRQREIQNGKGKQSAWKPASRAYQLAVRARLLAQQDKKRECEIELLPDDKSKPAEAFSNANAKK